MSLATCVFFVLILKRNAVSRGYFNNVRELMKQYGRFTDDEISKILEVCRIPDDNDKKGIMS